MNNETEQIFLVNAASNPATIHKDAIPGATLVNLESVQDFSTVCRTCATITEFVIPIFEGEGLQNNLADKIHKHLPIQVLEDDALPRVVCYQCASTLLAWHELVKCCVQADEALRARLAQMQQATAATLLESEWGSSKGEQNKSPPRYEDTCAGASPEPLKLCPYCDTRHPDSTYKDHLIDAHSELLFHCQECDTYVDRKEFIIHMSLHCVQYTEANKAYKAESKKIQKNNSKRMRKTRKKIAKDENQNTKVEKNIAVNKDAEAEETAVESVMHSIDRLDNSITNTEIDKTVNGRAENDFSDHSDAEYGFGPLPESVFNAIEDSQDDNSRNSSQRSENGETQPVHDTQLFSDSQPVTPEYQNESPSVTPEYHPVTDLPVTELQPVTPENQRECHSVSPENQMECQPIPPENQREGHPTTSEHQNEDKKNGKVANPKKVRNCPICSKTYTASSSYFYHLKYFHRQSKEHECEVCGRKFGTRASLAQHAPLHTGECQYECTRCGKQFKSKASLYIHSQIHTSNVGSKCGICGAEFRWRAALRRHAARHGGARAHACGACPRAFSVRADLLRHARTHQRGRHACPLCAATFAQPRYLRVHLNKKHGVHSKKSESEDRTSQKKTE